MKEQLAAAEARAEKLAAEFADRDTEHLAMLTAEQVKTEKAIALRGIGGAARRAGGRALASMVAAARRLVGSVNE